MHIMLEGVLPYEVKLMLTVFVKENKYFTIELLNERIKCYPYTQEEVGDRPSPIALSSSQLVIHQSGKDWNQIKWAYMHLSIKPTCMYKYTRSTCMRSTCHVWELICMVASWLKEIWFVKRRYTFLYTCSCSDVDASHLSAIDHWQWSSTRRATMGMFFAIDWHFTNHHCSYSFTWPGCVPGCVDTWPPQHVPSLLPYCFHYTKNALYGALSLPNSQVSPLLLLLKYV